LVGTAQMGVHVNRAGLAFRLSDLAFVPAASEYAAYRWKCAEPPEQGTNPVQRVIVVPVEFLLLLARVRLVHIAAGAVLYGLAARLDVEFLSSPCGPAKRDRRAQYASPAQPATRVDQQIAYGPARVIKIHVPDGADFSVGR